MELLYKNLFKNHFCNRTTAPTLQSGLTLHEALVVLAIISGLAIGVVNLHDLIQRNALTAHVNLLISHINLTRSEAIKRGKAVTLCKSKTGINCTSSSEWQEGWIIFADNNANHRVDADEAVILVQQPLAQDQTLNFSAAGGLSYVTYQPTGLSWPNGTFTFCGKSGVKTVKAVILSKTGRARIADNAESGACT